MMRTVTCALMSMIIGSCGSPLNPALCDAGADCASSPSCSQSRLAGTDALCGSVDTSTEAMDAGDASLGIDGGDASKCISDQQCSADLPVCGPGGVCTGCAPGSNQSCATFHASTPVCGALGACVECLTELNCPTATKPSCDLHTLTCTTCTTDAECVGRPGPAVCMAHQDGRCATDDETIYVQQSTSCTMAADPTGGTSKAPFCSLDKAVLALSPSRRLIVVHGTLQEPAWTLQGAPGDAQVSIIGQDDAVITAAASPGAQIVGSDVFIRSVSILGGQQVGISAAGASTLRLLNVSVQRNAGGGILVDASAFQITNALITGNGPGTVGTITWGGVLIQNPPPAGPAELTRISVTSNNGPGISCTGPIDATGVFAALNMSVDIGSACGFASCGPLSATCGPM